MLSSPESIDVQSVLSHLVVENPLGRAQQARGLCTVSTRSFDRVKDQVPFVCGNSFAQRQARECA